MRRPVTELGRLDHEIDALTRAIRQCHRSLRRMTRPAVSAEHSVRRAELAQVIRRQLDFLVPAREKALAERAQVEAEMAGA